MAEYDLTRTISPYLDRHMVWGILDFHIENKTFPEKDLRKAKAEVSGHTNMVDATLDEYSKIYGSKKKIPDDLREKLSARRSAVIKGIKAGKKACAPILTALAHPTIKEEISPSSYSDRPDGSFTLQTVQTIVPEVKAEHVEALYSFAKVKFDCGYYKEAIDMLALYLLICTNEEQRFQALWGKVAAEMMCLKWEQAFKDIRTLNSMVDSRVGVDQLMQLQQRTWIIHWSLFMLFSLKEQSDRIGCLDFLSQDKLFNTIHVNCPHVLRYLAAAMVVFRQADLKQKDFLKFIRVLKREEDNYSDPVTKLLVTLYIDFDYTEMGRLLQNCQKLFSTDHFLHKVTEGFIKNAKLLFFEAYCKIHQCIDMRTLASQLDIKENVEATLVNYIQDTGVNAKVDSSKQQLVILRRPLSVYQQVVDKTKSVSYRTNLLVSSIQKNAKNQD